MPVITVAAPEGAWDRAAKERLVAEITDAVVRVGGERQRGNTRILIQDVPEGNWGSGGKVFVRAPAAPVAEGGDR
ncbi:tautomerase family protein [Salinarimonas sp. NSM]|uniref:tautomerase family protein n=1 Tax=Salinarimonas sp. NSM TaxID=3458003 RepID=UPI00403583C3